MARRTAAQAAQDAEDNDEDEDEDEDGGSSPLPDIASLPNRRKQETKAQSAKRKKEEEVRTYVPSEVNDWGKS